MSTPEPDGIAVVGLACRMPGAKNAAEFWENLRAGKESIVTLTDAELEEAGVDPALIRDPAYVKTAPLMGDIEKFDAAFFGIPPREAELMDPQHRLFLQTAHEALECAGYGADPGRGRVGVFAGVAMNSYLLFNLMANPEVRRWAGGHQALLHGNDKDYVATRVSYKLNLNGPAVTVQCACSTSLVAVVMACQSLLSYQCDMVLAGGSSVRVPQKAGYLWQEGGIMSPDGHCRTFDAQGAGTLFGSGVGVVALKRLEDAVADGDTIYAVIRGFAMNNDGSDKLGYAAPSINGQAGVITEALAMAGVEPETISFIETHGTATKLGDPAEITALTQAFALGPERKGTIALGAVKANIGHLNTAAGVAGLIKAVLALHHKEIPPQPNFETPNPQIDFDSTPFYVSTRLQRWESSGGAPRRAGVSSFGIGGTNAHVVLEEAPPVVSTTARRPAELVVLSARSEAALEEAGRRLAATDASLPDIAHTLQVGRKRFPYRKSLVCRSAADLAAALTATDGKRAKAEHCTAENRPVAFLFPGQGAQHARMAAELYRTEPLFRAELDRCAAVLQPLLGLDIRTLLYETYPEQANAALTQTRLAQPVLFAVQYALAKTWTAWGIKPVAMLGHSLGELVAACVAGVFTPEEGLKLVATRGQLMQETAPGAMTAVSLPHAEVPLTGNLEIAAINAPNLTVVCGPTDEVAAFEQRMGNCRRLHTSHAFHSASLDPILDTYQAEVGKVALKAPAVPVISGVTGDWLTADQATSPAYWRSQVRRPVRFADGVTKLLAAAADAVVLEVGPMTLSPLIRQQDPHRTIVPSLPHPTQAGSDLDHVLAGLGKLWEAGAEIDWAALRSGEQRRRLPLPTYPFEERRFWIDASGVRTTDDSTETATVASSHERPNLSTEYVAPQSELEETLVGIWRELLGVEQIGIYDSFFELGGQSLLVTSLVARIKALYPVTLPMAELFANPTVAYLAQTIEEQLIRQLEAMSDEQASQL